MLVLVGDMDRDYWQPGHRHQLLQGHIKYGPQLSNSRDPPQGMRRARRHLIGNRFIHLGTPQGCALPPPGQAPLLPPLKDVGQLLTEVEKPGEGPPPEDPPARIGEIGPPPEDLENAAEAYPVLTLWMMSQTTLLWGGEEISPTY